jgi:hypothetical protein
MTSTEQHALRGAAGRRPNRDRGQYAGHAATAELHGAVRRGTAGPTGTTGCAGAAEATRQRMHILAPPAAGPATGPWVASGPEELRDSERSHGCRRDTVTVCFQSLPQVTVGDLSTVNYQYRFVADEAIICRFSF